VINVTADASLRGMTIPQAARSLAPGAVRNSPRMRALAVGAGLIPPRAMHTPAEAEELAVLARGARCVVEVGVYEGGSARVLANALDARAELHLVDPYPRESGAALTEGWRGSPLAAKLVIWRTVRGTGPRVCWHLRRGDEVGRDWRGPAVDLVFIDGDHSPEACRADWEAWHGHVRDGGAVAFHDARGERASGPRVVVDELFRGGGSDWRIVGEVDSLVVVSRGPK
jgi:predicted O-methyltransferase YrrM